MSMLVAMEERKERDTVTIMTSKRRSSGMTCSQRFKHYASDSEIFRAMSMIVVIEERKGRKTEIMTSKRRSSGTTCSQRLRLCFWDLESNVHDSSDRREKETVIIMSKRISSGMNYYLSRRLEN